MKFASIVRNSTLSLAAAAVFVIGTAVSQASAAGYPVGTNAKVRGVANWDQLNIRQWDAAYSQKIGEAYPNQTVYVIRCKLKSGNDWCKINAAGTVGWVNGRFLRKWGNNFASPHPAFN